MNEPYENEENGTGEEQREVSIRDFVSVLFRRRAVIIAVLLASLAVVWILNATSPVRFESGATLRVSRGLPESAFSSRMRVLTWEEELTSEIETVTSNHVVKIAEKILKDRNSVDSNGVPIEIDAGMFRAETPGKSAIIFVNATHPDPKAATEACRALTQAYTDFRLRVRSVPEVEEFFDLEIESLRDQLDEWESERARFMNEESVIDIRDERGSLLTVRRQSEVDLNRVRADLAEMQAKVEVLQARRILGGDELDIYPFAEQNNNDEEILHRMHTAVVVAKEQLYISESQYTEDHPQVLAARDRVSLLEEDVRTEMRRYVAHLESRVEVLRAREGALLRTLRFADSQLASLPDKEARLASYDRVLDQLRASYEAMFNKQIQAKIEKSGSPDWNVLILRPAGPALPIRTQDYVRMALIPTLALLLGVALAFAVDGLDHTLKDASEVESHLRLPVLGSVGRIR